MFCVGNFGSSIGVIFTPALSRLASASLYIAFRCSPTNRCCSFARNNHDGSKEKGFFVVDAKDGKLARTFVEVKAG